jgi:hypothetical protein
MMAKVELSVGYETAIKAGATPSTSGNMTVFSLTAPPGFVDIEGAVSERAQRPDYARAFEPTAILRALIKDGSEHLK